MHLKRQEQVNQIERNCIHYKGDRPCQPHKREGAVCRCRAYSPRSAKILMIQLSSPVTVIRSSALVHRFRADDPNVHIVYLTDWPELIASEVDEVLGVDDGSLLCLQMDQFNAAYNLDMDRRACAVMNMVSADTKKGFYLKRGQPVPLDESGVEADLYISTVMPGLIKHDRPDELQELFQLCGIEYRREIPHLTVKDTSVTNTTEWPQEQGPVIALNTAGDLQFGDKDIWPMNHWEKLAEMISAVKITSVLLGDCQTDELNYRIAQNNPSNPGTPVRAVQPSDLLDLISLVNHCDVMVSTAGATLELAWALGKEVVLLGTGLMDGPYANRGFGRCPVHDSYFHGRGSITTPSGTAQHKNALADILPDKVFTAVLERVNHHASREIVPGKSFRQTQSDDLETISLCDTELSTANAQQAISVVRSRVSHRRHRPHK
jgi:ADP-heptose:LPS heptosyltransferase